MSIVGEGQRTNTERQCGEVVVGQIGSVVGKVEGKCLERSGIRWRVTSGGIARGSGAVANCWRVQGRVGRGGISVPRRQLVVMVVVAC